ncbi:MAG: hypothetical protein ACI8XB_001396 [Patiriisocius sp.]|jgi:hypothetical protein
MSSPIRLVWDFHGSDSKETAEHHAKHLIQFAEKEKLSINVTGVEEISDQHFYAFLDVAKTEMIKVRDALRPHRGLQIE